MALNISTYTAAFLGVMPICSSTCCTWSYRSRQPQCLDDCVPNGAAAPEVHVDRRRDGLECGVLVADGYELDQLHPVGVAVGHAARQFQADRRLAYPPRTDERDEAVVP